jgi:hypothetical protein
MSLDIGRILRDWPYEPGQVTVRRVRGDDGRDKIQLRLDLGALQMETSGRPDGDRPHGYESLLEYHEHRLDRHRQEHGSEEGFSLDERACELLRSESTMYYHRYLAEFVLEDFEAVERDTMRNLRLFDFCRTYAREESDRFIMEQYRPYVLMMRSRARAHIFLRDNRPKSALGVVKKGIEEIRDFYKAFGQEDLRSTSGEVAVLRAMAKEIESRIPPDPLRRLKQELAKAVREEHYEEAAAIRDQIQRMTGRPPKEPDGPSPS